MKLAIFGANGQTGRLVTTLALEHGHHVAAVTRRPNEFPLTRSHLEVIEADARDPRAVAAAVSGVDAVLSTLGVAFTREPVDTYSTGTANIVAGMHAAGIRRLVVVSSTAATPLGAVTAR